jgi:transcriptional regulator with XRE-family HTH domain
MIWKPEEAVEWHQRVMWLRLSSSKCGRKKPMSQDQLAEKAGIHINTLSNVERGTKNGSVETLILVANALEVCPSVFLCSQSRFVAVMEKIGRTSSYARIRKQKPDVDARKTKEAA